MKVAQVLAFASTLAVAANGYSFADNIEKEEPVKESTGLTVNEESRIYGGKEVDIDRYPFAVSIRMDFFDEAFCGGALIAPGWVLTAGHCIKTDEFDLLAVLGSQEREGNAGEEIKVVKGFRHPQYHKKKHLYDIGLLKLAKPSTHETAKLCAEDGSDNEVGTVATIVGWGLTENRTESNTLLGVNVEIITNAECNKRYDNRITEGMLCAGKGDGKDSCNGDSGGPLIANNILVGIASWGRKCGARPGVYTRLTYVMDYINDIMGGGDGSKFAGPSSGSSSSSLSEEGSTESASSDASASTAGSSTASSESGSTSTSSASASNSDASTSVSSDSDSGSAFPWSSSTETDASNSVASASDAASTSASSDSESTSSSGSDSNSVLQFTKQESIDDVTQQSTDDVTQQSTPASNTAVKPETPASKPPSKKSSKVILLLDDEV